MSKGISVEVTGVETLQKSMAALASKYGQEVVKGAMEAGQLVRTSAIKSIQDVSYGHDVVRYRNGGNSYNHVASEEGDAPNTDTGTLASSVQVDATANYVFVGTTLKYGPWLEFGTKRMEARPWLNPALERNRKSISDIFQKKIDSVTNQGLK